MRIKKNSSETPEQIALQRIEEAARTGAAKLDLSGLGLTAVPEAVTKLTALTTLNLSFNQLTALPEAVTKFTALTGLDVSHNQLTALPEALGNLTALTTLSLFNNQLATLPEAIGNLTALTTLELSGNQLTALPEALGNLAALTTLDLSDNRLVALPEAVTKLTALTTLNLSYTALTALPEALGNLTRLTTLHLYSNQLTILPEVLGELTALTTLSLFRNQLTALPETLGNLTALTTLSLFNNQLATLPEAIGNLTALTTLELSGNQLIALPEALGNLTALTTLRLSSNQLTTLPAAITRLSNLKQLFLHKNERLAIPPEVLGSDEREVQRQEKSPADPQAILRFYFASKIQGKRPLAEAKVLVVGQGSVGKTSLIKYWRTGNACDGTEEKTTKIDITHHTLKVPSPGGKTQLDIALNVWDFGGQEIYHATHQFFLSKRSLYLLVLDARSTVEQNNVHYWFQMARSFGGDSRVLIVINKSEQHRLDLNVTGLAKDYGEQYAGVVHVSCKQPFGRDELTAAIRQQIAGMKDVFAEVPASYFTVKTALEKKAKEEDFLPYPSYERLCNKHALKEEIDQTTLIRFLHDLGVVLNFDDPDSPYKMSETTILNPDWVTDGVYAIINSAELGDKRGVLIREHLNRLLPDKNYPPERKPVIVGMMRKFDLCFEFPGEEGKKWLVPQLLPPNEPDLDWREKESLNFRFRYAVLPPGLVCQFIVRRHGNLTVQPTYWRSGVVLEIDGCRVLVRGDTVRGQVFITVQGPVPRRRAALAVIRDEFARIHGTMPGLSVEARVPLPDEPGDVTVSYAFLLELERDGEQSHRPEGARKPYRVADLLNGITTPEERDQVRREPDRRDDPPEPPKPEPKEPDVLDKAAEKGEKIDRVVKIAAGVVTAVLGIIAAIVAAVKG